MSDDEDEGRLQIDESPPVDYAEKPSISGDLNPNVNVNSNLNPNSSRENPEQEIENQEIPTQNLSKEDGELDEEEDEPMDTDDAEKVAKIEKAEEGAKENVNKKVDPSESMVKKSEMRPPQNTEKTPSSHRKRKESTENPRKSGLDTIDMAGPSTPQRSKRASSHQASAAITACFHDEDIVGMPPLPIQSTPTSSSSATLSAKRHKLSNAMVPPSPGKEGSAMANTNGHAQTRDASTSVITTRKLDTSGLLTNESIMDTPPGSLMTLEVTVMYRTKNSLAFRVNGCDILGFMSDGLPPMAHQNSLGPGTSNNNNKSKKNDDGKDGRSNSANSNGRSTRGGSVVDSKNEKHRKDGKRKKEEVIENDYVDEDSQGAEERKAQLELVELESNQLHDCHFEKCEKRFRHSHELEYHIAKCHTNRVLIYESICTQTDTKTHADVAIETDEAVAAQKEPMPVLKMEAPIKMPHVYEDLSDDEPTELLMKPSTIPTSSAAAALFGIAQASSSAGGTPNSIIQRPATSTPVTSRMNPSMTNVNMNVNVQLNSEKKKQQQQQHQQQHLNQIQKTGPPSSSAGPMIPIMPSVSAPPPPTSQMHAIPQFLAPGFPAGLMHNPQMAALAMDPRVMAAISSAHQQHPHHQAMNSRAPSRQLQDSHKIHELTKAKENEQRQRQAATPKSQAPTPTGASTPQRQFMPPHLMQQGTPQSMQHQHHQQQQQQAAAATAAMAANAAAQQHMMQQLQMQQLQRGMMSGPPDMTMAMLMMMGGAPPPGFPGTPHQPSKP